MDAWTASEASYKNGYIQGYIDAVRLMVNKVDDMVHLPHTNDTICCRCGAVMRDGQHLYNVTAAAWCPQCGQK